MKSRPVQIVLAAVVIAALGAFLHPLSLVLGFAPFDTHGFGTALVEVRTTIANLLGWGFLSLIAVTVAYLAWGRRHAMPGYRAQIGLLVVLLAVLGAILHPMSFLLSKLPWNTSGLVSNLNSARADIADVLGWALVALLFLMGAFVARDRFMRRLGSSASARSEAGNRREISDAG